MSIYKNLDDKIVAQEYRNFLDVLNNIQSHEDENCKFSSRIPGCLLVAMLEDSKTFVEDSEEENAYVSDPDLHEICRVFKAPVRKCFNEYGTHYSVKIIITGVNNFTSKVITNYV